QHRSLRRPGRPRLHQPPPPRHLHLRQELHPTPPQRNRHHQPDHRHRRSPRLRLQPISLPPRQHPHHPCPPPPRRHPRRGRNAPSQTPPPPRPPPPPNPDHHPGSQRLQRDVSRLHPTRHPPRQLYRQLRHHRTRAHHPHLPHRNPLA